MSQASEARTSALDRVLDRHDVAEGLSDEVFAVVDAIDASPMLRRTLSDPGSDPQNRKEFAQAVLGGKVSQPVIGLVSDAAALRWSSGSAFVAALERQGIRAELRQADLGGGLADVEDELFRFARLVEGQPEVRNSLADRTVPVEVRRDLVSDLLQGKVGPSTAKLARRAVAARERTFGRTIDSYVALAAEQRQRAIATVRVARPLDAGQVDRLTAALSRQAGRPIAVQVVVDPQVLGGVRVELGDQVIEGTVAGRLDTAHRLLSE
ncbi:F0F1 ATP synthase subunit delta [Propionibacteriaceae bacterium Y2011]|uniref:F0F1 ATP synthase subunit delta n=1 Tax=Microlunatus sp. Y2014 TaxID=3418488 RepID=UPI003B4E68AE